jgi:hypothetical protein
MLHHTLRHWGSCAALVALAALALAAPAGAKTTTYPVSGDQTVVDAQAGTYKMTGGLIGDWAITSYEELATTPLYRAKGTEHFSGCLDRGHDGSCANDPAGTLDFRFRYWAQFAPGNALVWGACWHPITGGTGAFKGASGVLMMADTPTGDGGFTTAYIGSVTLTKGARSSRSHARAAAVGASTCGAA